ncbi:NEW3 domain-containing protein [bacterium]|nr:NEW3 domain-containing protein [bacterium]
MPARRLVCCLLLLIPSLLCAAPHLFWASSPVAPGETVLLVGDELAAVTVSLSRLPDSPKDPRQAVEITGAGLMQPTNGSVKFVVPASWRRGLYRCEVKSATGAATTLLNRPVIWWLQGEGHVELPPGERLHLFGNCLGNTEQRPVTVELTGPKTVRLQAPAGVEIVTTLPSSLPEGSYQVRLSNGYGGAAAWSDPVPLTVRREQPWPTQRFDVTDFGADPQGQADCSAAVAAAIAKAAAGSGGVVFFPRGRYQLTQTIELPRFVTLQGEGRELVNLYWPDLRDPLPAQIKGTNSFALQDLTLYCSNYSRFLVGDDRQPEAGHVRLERLTIRADRYRGHMTADEVDRRMRSGGGNQCPLLSLGGRDVVITDCDLQSSGMVFWLSRLRGAYVARNTLRNGRWGWYCLSGSDGVILDGNRFIGGDLMATGGGLNCLDGSSYSQHVYYAHNTLTDMFGWDREAMTSDAGGGAYFGKVAASTPTVTTTAEDTKDGARWGGGGVYILDGKGMGQYRRVAAINGREITVDRPWDVPPDATSILTVCAFQGRCLFVGNDFTDAGVALQFYGNAIEHLMIGNVSRRTAGFHNFGMNYSNGIQPSWYLQWLDNTISEGNTYWSDHDNWRLSGEAHIGVYIFPPAANWQTPLTLGTMVRRNKLQSNAHIMLGCEWNGPGADRPGRHVRDAIVEHNQIARSELGIYAYTPVEGLVIRENRFDRVRRPLDGPGLAGAYVTPEERAVGLRATLLAMGADLGLWPAGANSATPEPLAAKLEALVARVREGGVQAPEAGGVRAPALQWEGLRLILTEAGRKFPQGLPMEKVAPYLGLRMVMPWSAPLHNHLQGRPGGGPSRLDLTVTSSGVVAEPMSVRAEVTVPAGWQASPGQEVSLPPGGKADLSVPVVVPEKAWAGHELPVALLVQVGDTSLRLNQTIRVGSGFITQWAVLGPFANKAGEPLDRTLRPPDDGVDFAAAYDGVAGKVSWTPVTQYENGFWINFARLFGQPQGGTAYIAACLNAPRAMPAQIRLGCSGGAVAMANGEVVWTWEKSQGAGPGQFAFPIHLKAGDNALVLKLSSVTEQWTEVCEIGPAPGGEPLTGVTVVPAGELKGRPCFAPPQRSGSPTDQPQHTGGVNWKLRYADDLSRPTLGPRWLVGSGNWKITEGVLYSSGTAFLCYAEKVPAPVRIEYDARAATAALGDLSACWLKDPKDYQSGLLCGFGANGNTVNKVVLGGEQVAQSAGPLVRPNTWHHVIVQILPSGKVQLIVDDQLSLEQQISPGEAKFPGLWSWGAEGSFRSIRIWAP